MAGQGKVTHRCNQVKQAKKQVKVRVEIEG